MNKITAKEILDSNQKPTVEVELETDFGVFKASVPSGVSTGKYEAVELRDADGGVKKALANINGLIGPALEKEDLSNQKAIDEILIKLDNTNNKSHLGANAILAVSIAVCRAGAAKKGASLYQYILQLAGIRPPIELPRPSFNMIEGGRHSAIFFGSALAFQEFMVIPQKETFKENLELGQKIYKKLKPILEKKYGKDQVKLSKEGAFSAPMKETAEALDSISEAIEKAGGKDRVKIAIDAAASEFSLARREEFAMWGEPGDYKIDGKVIFKKQLMEYYKNLVDKYPIISIEDPFLDEDFDSFAEFKKMIGDKIIIFGDDLTASNIQRIKTAGLKNACSGLILKPNQIGTVTETIEAAKFAKSYGWKIMVANRAGETEDDFIADLAVGIEAEFIKSGAPFPKERMVKYNRILAIEKSRS